MDNKNKETTQKISNIVNNFSFDAAGVAKAFSMEHKTLQQTLTRFCVEWLRVCASDDYNYDGRNEASHLVAKQLLDGHEELIGLPFI